MQAHLLPDRRHDVEIQEGQHVNQNQSPNEIIRLNVFIQVDS